MISDETLSRKHIQNVASALKASDERVVERALRALVVLDRLAESALRFVFKGGTSLLMHLPAPKRLSVDVDMFCDQPAELFEDVLGEEVCKGLFGEFRLEKRGAYSQPKRRHYRIPYVSVISSEEDYILIDVVEDPCPILDVEEKPLDMSFLKIEGSPTMVTLPKVSALLADKLTAFAPHTIGVKFKTRSGLGHEHQVMKQFVDIAQLYEYGFSISELRRNYEAVAEAEITYRDTMLTPEDALRDTMRTSFDVSCLNIPRRQFAERDILLSGVSKVRGDLIHGALLNTETIPIMAGRVAYLAALLMSGAWVVEQFPGVHEVRNDLYNVKFLPPLKLIEKMRRAHPEAFWYWAKIHELLPAWMPEIV